MLHPYEVLRPEYDSLLTSMIVTRPEAIEHAALSVLRNIDRYLAVENQTKGVPAALIGTLNYRESDQDFRTGLGQGDPWDRVSTHVPRNEGPFKSWEDAAIFYVHYDHLDDNSAPWTMPYVCWKGEIWNGFGPRNHGIHTGYLWAGTNHYTTGKYVADGVWDPHHTDTQLGIIPIMSAMFAHRPDLKPGAWPVATTLRVVPNVPTPMLTNTAALQAALNKLMGASLIVDGSYGRRTREAVRAFQVQHNLTTDGLAGPMTWEAINKALGA
jgi:lysozyme family protein